MNRLSTAKRTQIVAALVEGNSIRATLVFMSVFFIPMAFSAGGTLIEVIAY